MIEGKKRYLNRNFGYPEPKTKNRTEKSSGFRFQTNNTTYKVSPLPSLETTESDEYDIFSSILFGELLIIGLCFRLTKVRKHGSQRAQPEGFSARGL